MLPVACYMTHQAMCCKNSYDITFVHCVVSLVSLTAAIFVLYWAKVRRRQAATAHVQNPKLSLQERRCLAFRQSLALNINKMWLKLSQLLLRLPHSTKATRAAKRRGTQSTLLTGRLALKSYTRWLPYLFCYMKSRYSIAIAVGITKPMSQ